MSSTIEINTLLDILDKLRKNKDTDYRPHLYIEAPFEKSEEEAKSTCKEERSYDVDFTIKSNEFDI